MKILYVSQYFPPEMGAPAARVFELSREWVRLGHSVTVLTGFPNHPTGVIPAEYRGQYLRREVVDGINVVRVPIYAAANKGFARRIANYLSFAVSSTLVGPWVTDRPDVVVATSPQFLTAIAGRFLSWWKRVPFVFEVRDLWPSSIVAVGALSNDSPIVRGLEIIERALYRSADHLVVVTESFVDEIAAHGIDRAKISVVTNGVDVDLFQPGDKGTARRSLKLEHEFIATYVGTHGMAHGLDLVLDAAEILRDTPIHFLLVGEGAEKDRLKSIAAERRIGNVTFWDQRPRNQIPEILAASDVCLVLLRDKPLFKTVIPSKIFEFMGSGRPILTTVDGESRVIIERSGAGVFCPPSSPSALAEALRKLRTQPADLVRMGDRGRKFVVEHYTRPVLSSNYSVLLEDVVNRS